MTVLMPPEPEHPQDTSYASGRARSATTTVTVKEEASTIDDSAVNSHPLFEAHVEMAINAADLYDQVIAEGIPATAATRDLKEELQIAVPTSDIEADVDRFGDQYQYCDTHGTRFLCVSDGRSDPTPVDMSAIIGPLPDGSVAHPEAVEEVLHSLGDPPFGEHSQHEYEYHDPESTRGFFRNHLTRFLTLRMFAATPSTQPMEFPPPGIPFRVACPYNGLRVHYSPSYFLTSSRVFGSPTSPVVGWIQPGRYKFGVIGRAFEMRFDPANFDIPPLDHADLSI